VGRGDGVGREQVWGEEATGNGLLVVVLAVAHAPELAQMCWCATCAKSASPTGGIDLVILDGEATPAGGDGNRQKLKRRDCPVSADRAAHRPGLMC
jgi:hypothetical protein